MQYNGLVQGTESWEAGCIYLLKAPFLRSRPLNAETGPKQYMLCYVSGNQSSNTILFLIFPISTISISTTSSSFSQAGGVLKAATPLGVPVMITVPGRRVLARLRCLMIAGISKIRSSVPDSFLTSPLTRVTSLSLLGSGMASGDTRTGPIGANLSNDFA